MGKQKNTSSLSKKAAEVFKPCSDFKKMTVSVFVVSRTGHVLALKRAAYKDPDPKSWSTVGGGSEKGEDCYDAAIRETREESGLKIKKKHLIPLMDDQDKSKNKKYMYFMAFVDEPFQPELDEEHTHYQWIPLTEDWPEPFHERIGKTFLILQKSAIHHLDKEKVSFRVPALAAA